MIVDIRFGRLRLLSAVLVPVDEFVPALPSNDRFLVITPEDFCLLPDSLEALVIDDEVEAADEMDASRMFRET